MKLILLIVAVLCVAASAKSTHLGKMLKTASTTRDVPGKEAVVDAFYDVLQAHGATDISKATILTRWEKMESEGTVDKKVFFLRLQWELTVNSDGSWWKELQDDVPNYLYVLIKKSAVWAGNKNVCGGREAFEAAEDNWKLAWPIFTCMIKGDNVKDIPNFDSHTDYSADWSPVGKATCQLAEVEVGQEWDTCGEMAGMINKDHNDLQKASGRGDKELFYTKLHETMHVISNFGLQQASVSKDPQTYVPDEGINELFTIMVADKLDVLDWRITFGPIPDGCDHIARGYEMNVRFYAYLLKKGDLTIDQIGAGFFAEDKDSDAANTLVDLVAAAMKDLPAEVDWSALGVPSGWFGTELQGKCDKESWNSAAHLSDESKPFSYPFGDDNSLYAELRAQELITTKPEDAPDSPAAPKAWM